MSLPAYPSFLAALRSHATTQADRPAVRVWRLGAQPELHQLTCAELVEQVDARAAWLRRRCRPGDRVLTAQPTSLDLVVTILACFDAGLPVVISPPIDRGGRERDRAMGVVRGAGPTLVTVLPSHRERWEQISTQLPKGVSVVAPSDTPDEPEQVPEAGVLDADGLESPDPFSPAFLQFTSGSTAEPRGVVIHHDALLANIKVIRDTFEVTSADRYCGWLPLHHDMGLIGQLLSPLYLGVTSTMISPLDFIRYPIQWLELLTTERATFAAAPNFALDYVTRRCAGVDLSRVDLSELRVVLDGAEPIDPDVVRRFYEILAPVGLADHVVKPCYGLAEATLLVSGVGAQERWASVASSRSALGEHRVVPPVEPGDRVEVVDCGPARGLTLLVVDPQTGEVLPDSHVGEIWLQGDSVALGYWNNPEETERFFGAHTADGRGPFLRTGDLGALVDGRLLVTGRIKDVAVVNGRNIYPTDAERIVPRLHQGFFGQQGVFFATPSPREEAVLVHELIPVGQTPESLATLGEAVKEELTRQLGVAVANVAFVNPGSLPKTTSGKAQRGQVAELFLNRSLATLYEDVSRGVDSQRVGAGAPR